MAPASEAELSFDPELDEIDMLDFSLLNVKNHEGEVIGRLEPKRLLEGYEWWDWARNDLAEDAPHRQGLDFKPRTESELGPGHLQNSIKKMQDRVKASEVFLLKHRTMVCTTSSRFNGSTVEPPHALPLAPPKLLNTFRAPLRPVSQVLPSG